MGGFWVSFNPVLLEVILRGQDFLYAILLCQSLIPQTIDHGPIVAHTVGRSVEQGPVVCAVVVVGVNEKVLTNCTSRKSGKSF